VLFFTGFSHVLIQACASVFATPSRYTMYMMSVPVLQKIAPVFATPGRYTMSVPVLQKMRNN
jgi:hypothetical protein